VDNSEGAGGYHSLVLCIPTGIGGLLWHFWDWVDGYNYFDRESSGYWAQ